MSVTMAPQSSGSDPDLVTSVVEPAKEPKMEQETESQEGSASEGPAERIPLRQWVMHGAIMFGREFCYAMETALVTPVLLQIGLPEQYYSLTWFLSPILGLIFTPLIGSASDRCTLKWGRRRPFVLGLCVGVLLGVALFLNGSLIGLAIGDVPGRQTIGIVLTVVGVVLLDFCADAAEGPIRAYLLDVASNEEQDMALNIHAFAAGLGGAVGYMLGGLDWTHTLLGRAFKSQEQILFFFASILFIASVGLHLFSIDENKYNPLQDGPEEEEIPASATLPFSLPFSLYPMDAITEERGYDTAACLMRSKSDSMLAMVDRSLDLSMPDRTLDLSRADRTLDLQLNEGMRFLGGAELPVFDDPPPSPPESASGLTSPQQEPGGAAATPSGNDWLLPPQVKEPNGESSASGTHGHALGQSHAPGQSHALGLALPTVRLGSRPCSSSVRRRRHHAFPARPSPTRATAAWATGTTGRRRAYTEVPIKPSRSLSDIYEIRKRHHRQQQHHLQQRRHAERRWGVRTTAQGEEDEVESDDEETETTVRLLWLSMLKMPPKLLRLCICHLLTWFSIISQAVFYTDFMGQVIYKGDPKSAANSTELQNYNKGVQMGCWGLVIYAATAAICSALLQKYLDHFDLSVKVIYMLGTLSFTIGTAVMAIFPNVYVTMVMISTMGIISMSISYCPYALLGQYHDIPEYIHHSPGNSRRGFGIDCAILTCQVYIAQILVASALGAVVDAVGSVRVIPIVASGGAFLGFLTSTFLVVYPKVTDDEDDKEDEDDKSNKD
ncbi:hypothetical protein ANANG_G00011520 [Anguilla anguilla]|uniref:Solute carrier family 45 member 4 n=1 Tax=Anguilla anguilla TaxID=7936 RepID=A0A9D3SBA1_ANGAN|nr:hypothetical protein ANANG_G00011520 [Anguilla anguilla]